MLKLCQPVIKIEKLKLPAICLLIGALVCVFYSFLLSPTYRFVVIEQTKSFRKNSTDEIKYVSFCKDTFNSRRTGNLMFNLASLLYVAKNTGRHPVLPEHIPHGWIDGVFDTFLPRMKNDIIYNKSLSLELFERFGALSFDEMLKNPHSNITVAEAHILLICGYFQSIRYTEGIEEDLKNHFKFKNSTIQAVNNFIEINSHTTNSTNFVSVSKVGLHVRKTDFLAGYSVSAGLTTADEQYINKSIWYFVKYFYQTEQLIVFVCSDDIKWVKSTIENLQFNQSQTDIKFVYSIGHRGDFDMYLLTKCCDGLIISTGSFSWWAAWLANTTTIYYSLYPRNNSGLSVHFKSQNYYKQSWIGFP